MEKNGTWNSRRDRVHIYGLRETTSDLGIIVEYTFDDRNDFAFNNEGVLALRWTKNDIKSTSY